MIKFYEAVKINKNDTVNKVIKKINISKRDERYYPVGLYTKKDKIIGILSLGDIRRIAIKKINSLLFISILSSLKFIIILNNIFFLFIHYLFTKGG